MELLGYTGLTTADTHVISDLLGELEYLPLTQTVEDRAIALRQSHRIKLPDAIIAATALVQGYALLTLDDSLAQIFSAQDDAVKS